MRSSQSPRPPRRGRRSKPRCVLRRKILALPLDGQLPPAAPRHYRTSKRPPFPPPSGAPYLTARSCDCAQPLCANGSFVFLSSRSSPATAPGLLQLRRGRPREIRSEHESHAVPRRPPTCGWHVAGGVAQGRVHVTVASRHVWMRAYVPQPEPACRNLRATIGVSMYVCAVQCARRALSEEGVHGVWCILRRVTRAVVARFPGRRECFEICKTRCANFHSECTPRRWT